LEDFVRHCTLPGYVKDFGKNAASQQQDSRLGIIGFHVANLLGKQHGGVKLLLDEANLGPFAANRCAQYLKASFPVKVLESGGSNHNIITQNRLTIDEVKERGFGWIER
jgi:hypothetical protein